MKISFRDKDFHPSVTNILCGKDMNPMIMTYKFSIRGAHHDNGSRRRYHLCKA